MDSAEDACDFRHFGESWWCRRRTRGLEGRVKGTPETRSLPLVSSLDITVDTTLGRLGAKDYHGGKDKEDLWGRGPRVGRGTPGSRVQSGKSVQPKDPQVSPTRSGLFLPPCREREVGTNLGTFHRGSITETHTIRLGTSRTPLPFPDPCVPTNNRGKGV